MEHLYPTSYVMHIRHITSSILKNMCPAFLPNHTHLTLGVQESLNQENTWAFSAQQPLSTTRLLEGKQMPTMSHIVGTNNQGTANQSCHFSSPHLLRKLHRLHSQNQSGQSCQQALQKTAPGSCANTFLCRLHFAFVNSL